MYLFASLSLTACFFVGWLLLPRLRGESLLSAVVLAPFAVLGAVFVPAYWRPDHYFTFIRGVGIEDVLFCFACGGVCWIVASVGSGVHCEHRLDVKRFLSRFGCWAAIAILAVFCAWFAGCGILLAVILGFGASGLLILTHSPCASRLILPGAVGFTIVYACIGWLVIAIYPNSAGFWVESAISGNRILGLPIEELVWALSFGATWPVVFAYCLGEALVWRFHPVVSPLSRKFSRMRSMNGRLTLL